MVYLSRTSVDDRRDSMNAPKPTGRTEWPADRRLDGLARSEFAAAYARSASTCDDPFDEERDRLIRECMAELRALEGRRDGHRRLASPPRGSDPDIGRAIDRPDRRIESLRAVGEPIGEPFDGDTDAVAPRERHKDARRGRGAMRATAAVSVLLLSAAVGALVVARLPDRLAAASAGGTEADGSTGAIDAGQRGAEPPAATATVGNMRFGDAAESAVPVRVYRAARRGSVPEASLRIAHQGDAMPATVWAPVRRDLVEPLPPVDAGGVGQPVLQESGVKPLPVVPSPASSAQPSAPIQVRERPIEPRAVSFGPLADSPVPELPAAPSPVAPAALAPAPDPAAEPSAAAPAADEPRKSAAGARASEFVNMRTGPHNDDPVITVVPADAPLEVIECQSWCKVVFKGQSGWIYGAYVDRSAAADGGTG